MIKKCLWIGTFCFLLLPIIGQTKEAAMEHQTDLIGEVVIQEGNRMQDTVKASSAELYDNHHGSHTQVKKPVRLRIKDPQGDLVLDRVYGLRINYSEKSPEDNFKYDRHQVFTTYFHLYNPRIWPTEKELRVWLKAIVAGIEAQGWKRSKSSHSPDEGYTPENVPFQGKNSFTCFRWESNDFYLHLGVQTSKYMLPELKTEDVFYTTISLVSKKKHEELIKSAYQQIKNRE